jgi:uncharacterized protein YdhG (YjbR/CyaY superfamily)
MQATNFKSIDEYIDTFPKDVQVILQKLRQLIKKEVPEATEAMSYQIPTFKLNGNLVHFAAYKKHIGFYPTPHVIESFDKKLKTYKKGKGTLQFPLSEPIPYELVKEIVKFRVREVSNKISASKKTKNK